MNNWLSWQGRALRTTMTWVQTPGLTHFQYYFSFLIPMQHNIEDSPCSIKMHHPRVLEHSHQGPGLGSMLRFSQRHLTGSKSQQVLTNNWARLSNLYLQFWGLPPWFAHLIFFLFYLLIIYFNCCIILITCFI